MTLDLHSLKKATTALSRSLKVAKKAEKNKEIDEDTKATIRSGVILYYKIAYDNALKMMKRWIEMNISAVAVDGVTRRELFRQAAENRLIDDVDKWVDFHNARNSTSHIYDEEVAIEVFSSANEFTKEAGKLLKILEDKQ